MPLAEAHNPATIALASRTGGARAVRGCFDGRGGATWGRARVFDPIMGESWAAPSAGSHSRSSRAVVISCVNTDLGTRPGFVAMAWRDPNEPALALEEPQ